MGLEEQIASSAGFTVREHLVNLLRREYDLLVGDEVVGKMTQKLRFWVVEYSIDLADGTQWGRIGQKISLTGIAGVVYDGSDKQILRIQQNVFKDAVRNPLRPRTHMEVLDPAGRVLGRMDYHGGDGPLHFDIYDGNRVIAAIDQREIALGPHVFAVTCSASGAGALDSRALAGMTAMLDQLYNHTAPDRSKW